MLLEMSENSVHLFYCLTGLLLLLLFRGLLVAALSEQTTKRITNISSSGVFSFDFLKTVDIFDSKYASSLSLLHIILQ